MSHNSSKGQEILNYNVSECEMKNSKAFLYLDANFCFVVEVIFGLVRLFAASWSSVGSVFMLRDKNSFDSYKNKNMNGTWKAKTVIF